MSGYKSSPNRIIKNTFSLYFRLVFTLGITLYTSRAILLELGVIDFGIYNVVAGVVLMLSFLSGAMTSATQRFFSYEIGKDDIKALHDVFKMSINIHIIIVLCILIVAETLGVWFLNTHLTIPIERLDTANWVFQCAVVSFCFSIMSVPYSACIIAYERMNIFAFISVFEVSLKLISVLLLMLSNSDKLKTYSILLSVVSLLIWLTYYLYSKKKISISKYNIFWDKKIFKQLFGYTGWNLFGNLALVATMQGVNILLNIFFGAGVNAARAVAYQINSAVTGFVTSLQMSINPQIIKSYASDEHEYMGKLVFLGARFSFFLLYLISLPLLVNTDLVLGLWLKNVPENSVLFCRLVLVDALVISISGTLMTAFQATGNIKLYQIVVGCLILSNLPISYMFLTLDYKPEITFIISIFISNIALFARIILLRRLFDNVMKEFYSMYSKILISVGISFPLSYILPKFHQGFIELLISTIYCWGISFSIIWLFGITAKEKSFVIDKIKSISASS